MRPSSTICCLSFTFTRLFSVSFYLKKVGKVKEVVEQFKEIGLVLMRITLESVSLSELQIDLASFVTLLPNFVFFRLGVASSIGSNDSLVSFFGASLGALPSCIFSIALYLCILLAALHVILVQVRQ